MRCRVLALLLTAAVFSPVIESAVGRGDEDKGRVRFSSFSSNEDIRRKLLAHTPPGTSALDVLSFVIDRVRPKRPVNAYSDYEKAYNATMRKEPGVQITRITSRIISVTVAERPSSLSTSELVEAEWQFDEKGRVTDITVERVTIGP